MHIHVTIFYVIEGEEEKKKNQSTHDGTTSPTEIEIHRDAFL